MIFLENFVNYFFCHFDIILTTCMFIVAFYAMIITARSFSEQNRPYITFNYEEANVGNYYYLIVRNTGTRAASKVRINISPVLKSYLIKNKEVLSKIEFDFIAPNQIIKDTFDYSLYRHNVENGAKIEKHDIVLTYEYKNKTFTEKYSIDLTYLKTWIGGDAESNSTKHLKTIADSLKKIEAKIKK